MPRTPEINDAAMHDWRVHWDPIGFWAIYRRDGSGGVLNAAMITLRCPVESKGRFLLCRAEVIYDGSTWHGEGPLRETKRATLRTLVVNDQVVKAPLLGLFGAGGA